MIKRIKAWLRNRKLARELGRLSKSVKHETYTREQMEKVYGLGYNDGKRDGLSIARQQATNSLKEILAWQNKPEK